MSAVYQRNTSATAEFGNDCVVIKNGYTLDGTFYDITFQTTSETVQKLRNQAGLVAVLQGQMKAYLEASGAISAPEKTRFELLTNQDVLAVTDQGKTNITVVPEVKAATEPFFQCINAPITPPSTPNVPEAPVGAVDKLLLFPGVASTSNLLTFGPFPGLHAITGAGALGSGVIKLGHAVYEYMTGKIGAIEAIVKISSAVSEFTMGVFIVGSNFSLRDGAIACAVASSLGLLINVKELFSCLLGHKPLPRNFGWNLLHNAAKLALPILLLTLTFSNPLIPVLLASVALLSFIIANRGVLKEMFQHKRWWEIALFLIPMITSYALFALGIPDAVWISIGVALASTSLLHFDKIKMVFQSCCCRGSQEPPEELQNVS